MHSDFRHDDAKSNEAVDQEYGYHGEKSIEYTEIATSDALARPRAVVVVVSYADIAIRTMVGCSRHTYVADPA